MQTYSPFLLSLFRTGNHLLNLNLLLLFSVSYRIAVKSTILF
jgi:hypothetical protein